MVALPRLKLILVNRNRFVLKLYKRPLLRPDYKVLKKYDIAVGAIGHVTKPGVYTINTKARCPDWLIPNSQWAIDLGLTPGTIVPGCTEENPLKARWLGVTEPREGIGIHGTSSLESIGTRASRGCIRMRPDDVIELFSMVPLGTPCVIV